MKMSGEREKAKGNKGENRKGRKGFGYGIRNTAVRDLLGDKAYTDAIITFLGDAEVRVVKTGVLNRDEV